MRALAAGRVSFPAKLALANRIVNQRAALANAAGAAGVAALVASEPSRASEPDLTPDAVEDTVVRSISKSTIVASTVGLKAKD